MSAGPQTNGASLIQDARTAFHNEIIASTLLSLTAGIPSNAGNDSAFSVASANAILSQLPPGVQTIAKRPPGQTAGALFERAARNYVEATFSALMHLRPFLYASIPCKWTLLNDRAQNARCEALILVRNRKGRLPHTVALTAEPFPPRLASLGLGAGDLDCVYHFALPELMNAAAGNEVEENLVRLMVEGKRLKGISDLPLDLAA